MAKRKTQTRKKVVELDVAGREDRGDRMLDLIPTPPPSAPEKKLTVDIDAKVEWRMKLCLIKLESSGAKTVKKKFVQQAIVEALDKLEEGWGDADA